MNEVSECADALLSDFRQFKTKRQFKESELHKLQEQTSKSISSLKKQFSNVQNDVKTLKSQADLVKNSVPSDERFKQCNDENVNTAPDALTLTDDFKECVSTVGALPKDDYGRLKKLGEQLKQLLNH